MESSDGLLQGVRVGRQGNSLASRYAARLLAALGAEVRASPADDRSETAGAFDRWLDEGLRSGPPARQRILLTEDPRLRGPGVTVLVQPFGAGPYEDYAYADPVAYALSGWYSITGLQGRPPLAPALPLPSLAAGANAAGAALLALYGLEQGNGDGSAAVSVLDTTHRMLGPWPLHYPLLGNTPVRSSFNGYRWTVVAPTADGHVVTPYARPEWELIAMLLGEPGLAEPRWRDTVYALDHRDEFLAIQARGLARMATADVIEGAAALGLPWGAVRDAREVIACPQLAARGFWQESGGQLRPGLPLRLEGEIPGGAGERPRLPVRGQGPLSGLVVLDLGMAWAGPFIGRVLADAGATVIKVESGRRPDSSRSFPLADNRLSERWWDRTLSFLVANSGKYLVGLEIDRPEGRAVLERLLRAADVVINNQSPRVTANLGLPFEELARINPSVLYVTSTGFGYQGPFRDRKMLGWSVEAMCGITAATGYRDGPPICSRMPFPDVFSVLFGVLAVGAGLAARRRFPAARWIDVSQYECGVHAALPWLLDAGGDAGYRLLGNRDPLRAPQGVYPCAGDDAWLALAIETNAHWRALCEVIGRSDLAARYPNVRARSLAHDAIDAAISVWSAAHERRECERLLQARGVPAAAVRDLREVCFDAHQRRHGYTCAANQELGERPWPAGWHNLGEASRPVPWAAARFAQHNDLVLGDWLGISEDERAALRRSGILRDAPEYAQRPSSGGVSPERQQALGEIVAHDPRYLERVRAYCAGASR